MSASESGGWHPAYAEGVMAADQRFAAAHLLDAFLDACTAHLRCVAQLEQARDHREAIAELEAALQAQRTLDPPEPEAGVPDLYFALQRRLEAEVGPQTLAWLRLGLSRNDLDMTVYAMAARERLLALAGRLADLQEALLTHVSAHMETVLIACTHHQPAQPTTLAHQFAAFAERVERDQERTLQAFRRLNRCPLGAAALTGSSYPLNREASAAALGFDGPVRNTLDAVAAADWQLDLAALAQIVALGASRIVHELLSAAEAGWLQLPDALVQGSSIMPQKRNPVALEHARTRFSRALGAAQQLQFLHHNIPFADLNDVGTDAQEPLVATYQALQTGLDLLIACLQGARFDEAKLAARAAASDTTATELADELVRTAGLPFPEAHQLAASLVRRMAEAGRPLQQADPTDLAAVGGPSLSSAALRDTLSPAAFIARRSGTGGPAPQAVQSQLERLRGRLSEYRDVVASTAKGIDGALRVLRTPGKDVA